MQVAGVALTEGVALSGRWMQRSTLSSQLAAARHTTVGLKSTGWTPVASAPLGTAKLADRLS